MDAAQRLKSLVGFAIDHPHTETLRFSRAPMSRMPGDSKSLKPPDVRSSHSR